MLLSDVSVKRPVFAFVLSGLLLLFGLVSISRLAIREMPQIDSPVVSVSTSYPGASASVMESQVTSNLEDQLSGISGIKSITSTTRNGSSRISIEFDLDWDLNVGVSDVRDAVSRAQRSLPDDANDPVVSKDNGSGEVALYVNLVSQTMDRSDLTDYAERVLENRFSLINGVSSVDYTGALYKVLYVKFDPDLMAGRKVTTNDVTAALRKENVELPGGQVRNDTTTMSVRTQRIYQSVEDFEGLVVGNSSDGQAIYLRDIADVYIGAQNENSTFKSDGVTNLSLGIVPQSDANPLSIASEVRRQVSLLQDAIPDGTQLYVDYDSTKFIERAILEVLSTILLTAILVVLVLYLFIGQLRATLIPAITVPVSLIAAFSAAYFFGFSINLLTLMALILAIGLVVDDAIVVVENIYVHLDKGETPLVAAYKGTREVGFAVIATTMVLVMVFLPISFMEGSIGRLFVEFSVLLAVAVIFSSVIALTLSPALASKMLRSERKQIWLTRVIDKGLNKLTQGYKNALSWLMPNAIFAPLVLIGFILLSYSFSQKVPSELTPTEDRGVIYVFVKGAEGTSYNRMASNMEEVESRLLPLVGEGLVRSFSIQAPAFGGRAGDQTGLVILQLEDWDLRDETATQAVGIINKRLSGISDVWLRAMQPGSRRGSSEAVQFVLGGADYDELHQWAIKLQNIAEESGIMQRPDLDYSQTTPELLASVNKDRANQLGIAVSDVANALEIMLGGRSETTFVERGEEYDVYLRGDEDSFNSVSDLSRIYLRTDKGELVTLDTVATIEEVASAQRLSHFQKQKSITLKANVADGSTLGEALAFLQEQAREILPPDIVIDYAGESRDFVENQSSTWVVFALALLVVYLVLAAQFESFINPLVVMFTVPMGIAGGFMGLWLNNQGLNIYSQIGLIMLIGMVTKNGILIVEFINQLRDRGLAFETAIVEASARRLRPILMTAATTLFGSLPLLLASGAGSESRIAVGTVVFFGMLLASLVSLFIVPMMYRLLCKHTHSPDYVAQQLEQQLLESETKD
ncbi:efflux RND transporter permease subunit [Alginatibacterium sediminis]|uniref:Efflux RND transporter permease subunit n=1 Tax=Alginatibacterium sediminis TaxID=2164068 RepID=A0A420EKY0_9ALTE|nr:efflux RND transporter permease subunit [Alginatibacterium sediminis]RKF21355.1 efflux RND transporter permease subunit [Alginatibacterium sediminis]